MYQSSKRDWGWRAELKMNLPILEGSIGRRRVERGFAGCCCAEGTCIGGVIVLGVRFLSRLIGRQVVVISQSLITLSLFCVT